MAFSEEMLLANADRAFANHEFVVYYQPQYNAATGRMVGAEALVRWKDPAEGLIAPGYFISCFEKNGLISRLDLYVFEEVCRFQKQCIDEGTAYVPVSVNLSRADVYTDGFVDVLCSLREKYALPDTAIRVEITESVAVDGKERAQQVIRHLHEKGFLVEVDDFGTGFSSLGILKNVAYDVLKLDMSFLSDDPDGRGSTILMSVVRMARWLSMNVIAEGVETKEQLSFLRSIGCDCIQGYIFMAPIAERDYAALLARASLGAVTAPVDLKYDIKPANFWNEHSLNTVVFNNFAGSAALMCYVPDGKLEILRVNSRYLREIGMNADENEIMRFDIRETMDEANRKCYEDTLHRVITTGEEQECDTWRSVETACCGLENLCIRSRIMLIGHSQSEYIFFVSIFNVTEEMKLRKEARQTDLRFKNVMEQVNIYYWEYNVSTRDMFPCYRCMRDLGLPAVVHNYPEPAIEAGIFPQDYADMYRSWHERIAAGEKTLEGVIPLTPGRVPFHVRYETEFDELGRPVRAHGSATYIPEEK